VAKTTKATAAREDAAIVAGIDELIDVCLLLLWILEGRETGLTFRGRIYDMDGNARGCSGNSAGLSGQALRRG
jgi:hypothetical protein